ncbi:hypothetical protein BC940DRAFT_293717 [Gongronella butleri]|nr:hypothetical protein BC940DRAFT_293717 [Gongronella butleri]
MPFKGSTPILPTSRQDIDDGVLACEAATPIDEHLAMISDSDPTWLKCKSSLWGQAGRVQTRLGAMTGLRSLEQRGQTWETWASSASKQARRLSQEGVPSRLHGEYSRVMGIVGKVMGYVSGDDEYEFRQMERTEQANDEIYSAQHPPPHGPTKTAP